MFKRRSTEGRGLNDRQRRAAAMWRWTGTERPSFAEPVGDGERSVWDFPRPPSIRPLERLVRIAVGSIELARSERALEVCETASPPTVYLPTADVDVDQLVEAGRSTVCEWKGQALHWRLREGPEAAVAWSYEDPTPEFEAIRGHLAFYPARVDCWEDDERVSSQAGGFYGGWITAELKGPWKGGPGTSAW